MMMNASLRLCLALLLPSMVAALSMYDDMNTTHWWCCTDGFCGQSCCAAGVTQNDPAPFQQPPPLIEQFFNWGETGMEPDNGVGGLPDADGWISNHQVFGIRRYAATWCEKKFEYTCDIHIPGEDPPTCTGTGNGDPHFKTWTGEKFDYHGECDLVLIDNPSFNEGQGLRVHIRTTRVDYFSYIERIAVQIGEDVLEFANDAENFLLNGSPAEPIRKYHKTMLGGFIVRRNKKSLSIRLTDPHDGSYHSQKIAKIDLKVRHNGFSGIDVTAGENVESKIFEGALGLLGEWPLGRPLARDGKTAIKLDRHNATDFALEWQVRDTEPMLFKEARFPQYPQTCTPPAKMMTNRLGMSAAKAKAEEVCASWGPDKDDCIFDVIATRDIGIAQERTSVTVG